MLNTQVFKTVTYTSAPKIHVQESVKWQTLKAAIAEIIHAFIAQVVSEKHPHNLTLCWTLPIGLKLLLTQGIDEQSYSSTSCLIGASEFNVL